MKYNRDIKEFKEWSFVKDVLYYFVWAVLITILLVIVCQKCFGLRFDMVLSDSMAPTFTKQDMIIVKAQDSYKVGDVVEYQQGGTFVTHRVQEIRYDSDGNIVAYITKGDNSSAEFTTEGHAPSTIKGKVIGVFYGGHNMYEFFKRDNNYFLLIDLVLGLWAISTTIQAETEIKKHIVF